MQWVIGLGNLLGGKERTRAMLAGQGVSIILKSINVNFRRPVTFPDTVRDSSPFWNIVKTTRM
jgi:hypothetical protein